jgi:hypothetical protein
MLRRAFVLDLSNSSAAAFVAALAVRVAAILILGHYRSPTLWENGVIAQYLLDGCGFCLDFGMAAEPSSWQAPFYPALLFISWLIAGRTAQTFLAISLVQAVALASIVFPLRWLTSRWFGERAGVVAMWMTAVFPLYVWYATRLHQAGLAMAVQPWLVWYWLRLRDRITPARAMGVGALSGLSGLLQPIVLLVTGAIGGALLLSAIQRRDRSRVLALCAAALAAAVIITPWTYRNYVVHHRLVPIRDSFGKELWMGNNPNATGTSYAAGGETEITYAFPPRAFELRGRAPEADIMTAMMAEALQYIRAEPVAFVRRTAKKIWWFWTVAPDDLVRSRLGGESLRFRGVQTVYWVGLAVLAAVGLMAGRLSREYGWLLVLYLATYSAIYGVTHVGQARYRGEMEFIFIPLAALGLTAVARVMVWHSDGYPADIPAPPVANRAQRRRMEGRL